MEITEYVETLSHSSEGWEKFETKPKEKNMSTITQN